MTAHTDKHTYQQGDRQTDIATLDQLGPEGQVGENSRRLTDFMAVFVPFFKSHSPPWVKSPISQCHMPELQGSTCPILYTSCAVICYICYKNIAHGRHYFYKRAFIIKVVLLIFPSFGLLKLYLSRVCHLLFMCYFFWGGGGGGYLWPFGFFLGVWGIFNFWFF